MQNKSILLIYALVLLLAYGLRVHHINSMPPGLHFDEAQYLYRAWRFGEGYGLNIQFNDSPEPFDPMLRGMLMRFTGYTDLSARIQTVWLNVLAVAATMAAARALYRKHPHRRWIIFFAGLTFATLPASTIMGRYIYRMNHLPLYSMLAVTALMWAWHTRKRKYFVMTGIFSGLAAIFYLAGLVFPFIMGGGILLTALINRRTWPGWINLILFGGATLLAVSPWLYLYITVPDWLGYRTGSVRYQFTTIPELIAHAWRAVEPIYQADIPFLMAPRYNTFTTAYLNPALLVLFVVGVAVSLWNWRKVGALWPLMVGGGLMVPSILTDNPAETIRLVGIFGPLGLLVGVGAGSILQWQDRLPRAAQHVIMAVLTLTAILSPVYTADRVWYHFNEEPRLLSALNTSVGMDGFHYGLLRNTAAYISDHDGPLYVPINHLNQRIPTAWLRPENFPAVDPYAGETLPTAPIFVPLEANRYEWPPLNRPTTFVMTDPQRGHMTLLPPVSDVGEWMAQVEQNGTPITNEHGVVLGHQWTPDAHPLVNIERPTFTDETIATFDENLQLLAVDMPEQVIPGEWMRVVLWWRLDQNTSYDYYVRLQLWNSERASLGTQNDEFASIYSWFYPTSMWTAGDVVPEVRWLRVFDEVPAGGYYMAIKAETYPFTRTARLSAREGIRIEGNWALAARTAFIPDDQYHDIDNTLNTIYGEVIRLNDVQIAPEIEDLNAGDSVTVNLYWEALRPPPARYTIFVHVLDEDGQLITQQDVQPLNGGYPTDTWRQGTLLITTHTLTLPMDAPPPIAVHIGLYDSIGFDRLSVTRDGQDQPDNVLRLP